ncbi:MAG: hypothetical protein ACYC6G_20195 [Desulfobaccales bacterium]
MRKILLGILAFYCLSSPDYIMAGPFVAYSLKEAERRITVSGKTDQDVVNLGGITDLAGMVYYPDHHELIIVGKINDGKPPLYLDDLVVAMRALFIHKKYPLVSIDRTPETSQTKKQVVTFEGGLENTVLGKDMLEADVVLKKLALGKVTSPLSEVPSYLSLSVKDAEGGIKEDHVNSRFWFFPVNPALAVREGVFAIMNFGVGVETEVVYAETKGKKAKKLAAIRDEVGEEFAQKVAAHINNLSGHYPILARVRPIIAMVALAEGVRNIKAESALNFWLTAYEIPRVDTPQYYELLQMSQQLPHNHLTLILSGGMVVNPLVVRLEAGDVTALKEAVLNSRPAGNALTWHPPLEGWQLPGTEQIAPMPGTASAQSGKGGFTLDRIIIDSDLSVTFGPHAVYSTPLSLSSVPVPRFEIYDRILPAGGVQIAPKPQKKGSGGKELEDKVMKSRPTSGSRSWEVPD